MEVERLITNLNFKQFSSHQKILQIFDSYHDFSKCMTIVFNATLGLLLDTTDVVAETAGNFLIRQPLMLQCVNPYAFSMHLVMGVVM